MVSKARKAEIQSRITDERTKLLVGKMTMLCAGENYSHIMGAISLVIARVIYDTHQNYKEESIEYMTKDTMDHLAAWVLDKVKRMDEGEPW